MKEWKIALLILIWPTLLVGGSFYLYQRATTPKIEVRNLSRTQVEKLTVEYAPSMSNGVGMLEETFRDIKSGANLEFKFPKGEFFVNVSFTQAGKAYHLECGVIGDTNTGMFLVSLHVDPERSGCAKFAVLERPN